MTVHAMTMTQRFAEALEPTTPEAFVAYLAGWSTVDEQKADLDDPDDEDAELEIEQEARHYGADQVDALIALARNLLPVKPPEVEVHVTPGAKPNADAGEEGVVHLVCPHEGCRAVDRIAVVETAGEYELGMGDGAYFVDGDLIVDFRTVSEFVETEWQDKHVCQACLRPVSMPDYTPTYDGDGF